MIGINRITNRHKKTGQLAIHKHRFRLPHPRHADLLERQRLVPRPPVITDSLLTIDDEGLNA